MRHRPQIQSHHLPLYGVIALALWAWPGTAHAQLRIVNYNTAADARTGMNIVLQAIGEEIRNGFAKPIDILALQEQTSYSTTTQSIVSILNGVYGVGTYAFVPLDGGTTGAGRPGLIYNTNTIQVIGQAAFGPVGTAANQQPRATLRYQLRPMGYDSSADFYIYNSHYKASDDSTSENRRLVEANSIRTNLTYGSNALGVGAHVIYTGDFNMYTAGEPAFQKLLEAGNGQAFDPLGLTDPNGNGDWHINSSVAYAHTQSPCATSCSLIGGGMDDRFDFQLMTGEFLDGEGLSYITGSYHAFGNNGSTYNTNINSGSNSVTFPGVTSYSKSQILNALWSVTDHLPVVVDYQLPAVLEAMLSEVPTTLNVGEVFHLDLTVSNAADVLQPIGADELDYSITTTHLGALMDFSEFDQLDLALGGGNQYQLPLDTSTPGLKTDVLTIASPSQSAQNSLIEIPISYEVLAATMLDGDFNEDGTVDAADYVVWRDGLGTLYDEDDYVTWKNNFGQSLGSGSGSWGSGGSAAVPEPSAALLLVVGACWLPWRPATLRAWNRKR